MPLPSVGTVEMKEFSQEIPAQETGTLGERLVHKISLNDPSTLKAAIAVHESSAKQASNSYLKYRVVAGISAVVLTIISAALSFFVFPPALGMGLAPWIITGISAAAGISAVPFGFSAMTGWSPIKAMKEHKETAQEETQIVKDLKEVEKNMLSDDFKAFVKKQVKEDEIDENTLIGLSKQFNESKDAALKANNNMLKTVE